MFLSSCDSYKVIVIKIIVLALESTDWFEPGPATYMLCDLEHFM